MFWTRKKPVAHSLAPNLYQFRKGEIFTNGAQEYVLDMPFTNPILLVRGAGHACGQMRIVQHVPSFANLAVPVSSLGGIQQGQFALQPLISPNAIATPPGLGL